MDLARPRLSEWITGLAGVALIVSLFLPWYEGAGRSASGWGSLAIIDVLLVLAALMAIGVPALAVARRSDATLIGFSSFTTFAALLAVLLTLARTLAPADSVVGGEGTRQIGTFLALAAALTFLVAVAVSIRDDRPRGLYGAAAPPAPPVRGLGLPEPSGGRSEQASGSAGARPGPPTAESGA